MIDWKTPIRLQILGHHTFIRSWSPYHLLVQLLCVDWPGTDLIYSNTAITLIEQSHMHSCMLWLKLSMDLSTETRYYSIALWENPYFGICQFLTELLYAVIPSWLKLDILFFILPKWPFWGFIGLHKLMDCVIHGKISNCTLEPSKQTW